MKSIITVLRRDIFCGALIFLLALFAFGSARGEDYLVPLRYNRVSKFPALQKRLGNTLGIVPFQDQRPEKLHIGYFTSPRNLSVSLDCEPMPVERAIEGVLSRAVSQSGVKVVPISNWDGKSDSLKEMEVDSILRVVIERFWVEGRDVSFRTRLHASFHFTFQLGIKQEGRVFGQDIFVERNRTFTRLSRQAMAQWINRTVADTLEGFLRNPY